MTDTDQSLDPLNDKFHGDIEAFRSYYQWDASRPTNFGFPDSVDVATEAARLGTPDPDQNAHPGAYLSGGPFVPPVSPRPATAAETIRNTTPEERAAHEAAMGYPSRNSPSLTEPFNPAPIVVQPAQEAPQATIPAVDTHPVPLVHLSRFHELLDEIEREPGSLYRQFVGELRMLFHRP